MEFGVATATLSKKLSNGCGVSGRSAYDGVFATSIKLRAPSFSYQFEDYSEIFGGSEASLGSSIPILELPELNDKKKMDDIRRSKLDYSKVFGGFGNLDTALPVEELLAEHKEIDSFSKGASARSKAKGGKQSCREDRTDYSKEIPLESREASAFNDSKSINVSYHKANHGTENGTNGTTHIAQLHAVPAYTCLIEEVNPVKVNRDNKSMAIAHDAYFGSHRKEGIKEGGCCTNSFLGPSSDSAKKQSSNGGVKVKNRSDSIDLFFDACEISNGSDGTHHIKVPPSEALVGILDNHKGDAMRSMATKCQASKSDTSEGADSPSYLDDMVDSNSEAAASLDALRKAIEEAQVRLQVAKESMRRKKEGFPDRVKRKPSTDLKAEVKREAKPTYKTMKLEEINMCQTFEEMDALPQVSSEIGKPVMRIEKVRSDLRAKEMFVAKEAVTETQKKLISDEVEPKERDHKAKVLELKEADSNKKVSPTRSIRRNAFGKPEKSDQTIEVVMGDWEQENNEKKVWAGNEAGGCEELVDVNATKHGCQELVDKAKLVQETLDNGTADMRLKVNEDGGEVEDKVTPYREPEDCERKLDGQGLTIGNENKVDCKVEEDEKKVEGSFELEECERNLRAFQELREVKRNTQEQKGTEKEAEVSRELEECELTEFLELIDKGRVCDPPGSDLKITEREIENLGCAEVGKRRNEAGFLDINQYIDHSSEREGTDNTFCNIYMQDGFLDINQEIDHCCQREGTVDTFSNIYVQGKQEKIVDHIYDGEEICERVIKDSELNGNVRVQDPKESENELERATHLMVGNEKGREDNKEPAEVLRMTETGPAYKEIKANEAVMTTETSFNYEPDETEKLSKIWVADTIMENDETLEVTPQFYVHDVQDDIVVASDAPFQHQGKCKEQESAQETNVFSETDALETSASTQDGLELNEAVNQMENTSETVTFEGSATCIDEKVGQDQDQHLEKAKNDCNLAMLVEEPISESVEICDDAKEARNALNEEVDENLSNSSHEENLFENEHNKEKSQIPGMSEWKPSPFKEEDVETIHCSLEENHQASLTMEEKEANGTSQQVQPEKEHLKKIDEAKEREREREKEKLAVERAIREARERAFADARERAAVERAAAEARQKNISDGREKVGKITGQANEKTLAEKAAMEAKLKAERAAVERATAEARARALERALSEKVASEARNKSDKSDAEKCFGASRDNGIKQNFYSKSFSHGVRDSTDVFDGANGDSAQRCKARSERHQRIGERVAKALAEKNMRDRLVQKEQEERNRIAEALDADVKRWSSGKTGNLRALLSTLQYILGPDSGWQPIPLTDIVTTTAVKKAYRKATLFVHPDKLQQRGANIQQKYTCEKVFDLLKEAWNRFNMEER